MRNGTASLLFSLLLLHTVLREQMRLHMGRGAQHSAGINIMDRDGVMLFVDGAATQFPRLRHIWLHAGYNGKGKGKDWTTKLVQQPPKPRYIWLPINLFQTVSYATPLFQQLKRVNYVKNRN